MHFFLGALRVNFISLFLISVPKVPYPGNHTGTIAESRDKRQAVAPAVGVRVAQIAFYLDASLMDRYCRFEYFHENFIFANSIKRHISDVKKSRLRQDLPISINDRVILPFREGFIFAKIKSSRKFPNLQNHILISCTHDLGFR